MSREKAFTDTEIIKVNAASEMAEELVSNFYKMSANQWLRRRYDIKTLAELEENEIVDGPFAQIIRYEGRPNEVALGSASYDFYKICLQDHTIKTTLEQLKDLSLFPFILYIITHELIHIIRFTKFVQSFEASEEERMVEEKRVHKRTHTILQPIRLPGLQAVLDFYQQWRIPYDNMKNID
jgi:hypothetical protein